MNLTLIIFLAVLAIVVLWAVSAFNSLTRLKNEIANAFGQIDVQLKRRYDLIPNLVESAKKYLSHERETLEAVIAARNRAHAATNAVRNQPANAQAITALASAELGLQGSMGQFMALNERYPELKADQTLRDLSEELNSTENRVAFCRQAYNDSLLAYNDEALQFPTMLVSKLFGFDAPLPMLQATQSPQEREAVRIQLG